MSTLHRTQRNNRPDPIACDTVAADEIKKIRPRGDTPFLLTGETKKTEPLTKSARRERVKRTVDRAKYEEISRCFPRERWEGEWTCPKLLAAGKHRLDQPTSNVPLTNVSLQSSRTWKRPQRSRNPLGNWRCPTWTKDHLRSRRVSMRTQGLLMSRSRRFRHRRMRLRTLRIYQTRLFLFCCSP